MMSSLRDDTEGVALVADYDKDHGLGPQLVGDAA